MIAKFEFRVTVYYDLWANASSCDPSNTVIQQSKLKTIGQLHFWISFNENTSGKLTIIDSSFSLDLT